MAPLTLLSESGLFSAPLARVVEAAAAGTLTRAKLRAGIQRDRESLNQRSHGGGSGSLAWERQLFQRALWPGDRILVIGSGSGRELIALAERGHEVVGVEPAAPAVALARADLAERRIAVQVLHGFAEELPLPGTFDVVIFAQRSYGLIQGATNRIAALRKCRMALNPDGRLIASYSSGRGMRSPLLRVTRLAAALTRSDLHPERGDDFHRVPASSPYFAYEHYFQPGEFESEAKMAGLHVEAAAEGGCRLAVLTPQTRVRRTAMRRVPTLQTV